MKPIYDKSVQRSSSPDDFNRLKIKEGRTLQEYIKKIYTEAPGIKEGYIVMNTEYISASYREKGE